jgi:hypothetical protein
LDFAHEAYSRLIVVVVDEHNQPRASPALVVLEHLFVADGVAERGDRTTTDLM